MPDGDVWLSCAKKIVAGNVRETGYDLSKLWSDRRTAASRKAITKEYSTMAANAFYSNYACNLRNMPKFVWASLGRFRK